MLFLIALIFIIESFDKLLQINQTRKYSNDPLTYVKEYNNDTDCFRCLYTGFKNDTILKNVSLEFLNEKQV